MFCFDNRNFQHLHFLLLCLVKQNALLSIYVALFQNWYKN